MDIEKTMNNTKGLYIPEDRPRYTPPEKKSSGIDEAGSDAGNCIHNHAISSEVHVSSHRSSSRYERERDGRGTERVDFRDGGSKGRDGRKRPDYGRKEQFYGGEARREYEEYGKKRSRHDFKRAPGMLTS
ncbi:hypothetical protein SLEP1_g25563 [Rubroshorea leprosula]|uniref:Uncharacterized protein n=1 Tax=Rubroshorea leprosula TaxID=152421 RepID=A0AAV5JJ67_9ROSI|nr:hypothetical protein SLEP1_g25563 [Rubroshorea leprosula]